MLLGITVWYAQGRIFRSSRAVRVLQVIDSAEVPASFVQNPLIVACYNIAHGRGRETGGDNWNSVTRERPLEHLSAIAEQIAASRASIVVLNEVDFDSRWSDGIDQAKVIAAKAGFPYLVEQRNFDVTLPFFNLQFGNAILSKYPISSSRFLKFPALSASEDIFAGNHDGVIATLDLPDGPLQVVAVHLEYRDEATRVGTARLMSSVVLATPETPLIALGDFNTAPRELPGHTADSTGNNAVEILLSEAGMKTNLPMRSAPAVSDLTFPSTAPDRILDWILVSRGLELGTQRVIASELSDHRMVVGTVVRNDLGIGNGSEG